MPLKFATTTRRARFLDPFNQFQPADLKVEVRGDPLTGDVARVLKFRARPLGEVDHSLFLKRAAKLKCPFCPENIESMCARYLPRDVPEGNLRRGQATCIPNAFPYEAVNGVVILTREHYLQPRDFSAEILADGLLLSRDAFRRLAPGMSYGSVNWNYMMPAGAGLVHPHFQFAAGKTPTRAQARLRRRAKAYSRAHDGADIVADYLAAERRAGARWLGRLGPAGWTAAFAPRAIYDLMALVPGDKGLLDLSPKQALALGQGMTRVLTYFQQKGVAAFNLGLHTQLVPGTGLPFMLRLVSRVEIPPMGVDEINYFEKLHDEMLTFLQPEMVAEELKDFWK